MILHDVDQNHTEVMVLFKIISRHSWDKLQAFVAAHPGSRLEHVVAGTYVVHVPAGGALESVGV